MIRNEEVINAIEWDGDPETWSPPVDVTMVQDDVHGIGWGYVEGVWIEPPPPPPPVLDFPTRLAMLLVDKEVITQGELDTLLSPEP